MGWGLDLESVSLAGVKTKTVNNSYCASKVELASSWRPSLIGLRIQSWLSRYEWLREYM